jgi:hypothetical protein
MTGSLRRAACTVAVLTVLLVGCGATLAFAHWRTTGAGAGSASTGTAAAVTIGPATPSSRLHPGARAEVALAVTNPNTTAVTVASLALDTTQGDQGFSVDAAHAGCDTSTLTFTRQTNAGAGWLVPARVGSVDGTLSIALPDSVLMGDDADQACQGAQFDVHLVAGS